jgi:hypothetical protein
LLLNNDKEELTFPDDFYSAIITTIEKAQGKHSVDMELEDVLYLFEFSEIHKAGGLAGSFTRNEWPGIQTPHAIIIFSRKNPLRLHASRTTEICILTISPFTRVTRRDVAWTSRTHQT